MKKVVVASTEAHAKAMIRWLRYDPEFWHPIKFGDTLKGVFSAALVVRPVGEICDDHALWVHETLAPRVFGPIEAVPSWATPDPEPHRE